MAADSSLPPVLLGLSPDCAQLFSKLIANTDLSSFNPRDLGDADNARRCSIFVDACSYYVNTLSFCRLPENACHPPNELLITLISKMETRAGPLENVTIPKDKDGRPRKYAFITFKHAVSVPYTVALMNGISLYGKQLNLDARTGAESEHNPYLEKLMQFTNCQNQISSRNYNSNQREPYDENAHRYEPRRYERGDVQRSEYNSRHSYVVPNVHYGAGVPNAYGVPNQGRYAQNSMPPGTYSNRYGGQMPWSRSHH